ncbi:MAG TPA: DUF4384 domain-containing protein [Gemmatimonadaceae bacterium]|nr:DUF4384 domain-containing protein [Gemmatimonadaceae bacterium]
MFSAAMLSILLSAAATAPLGARAAVAQADDPAIKVSLNHRTYDRGDRARVNVKVRDDGYVVVLQLRADGLVRVLYPLDPGNDDFVRGNQSYEVRGRGDREAFTVESANGTGTVYAAWSAVPFNFANFVRGDHWDYGVIGDSALPRDPETGFTNLVQRMAGGQFQYDLVSYSVQGYVASAAPNYYATAGYSSCAFDPWCDGYGYGSGYGYGYAPYGYAPYGFAPYGFAGSCFGASIWAFGFGPCYAFSPFGYYPYRYNPYGFGFGYPFGYGYYNRPIVVINNVPFRPYRWKGGGLGGGGVIGVPYRPRNFASTTSPIGRTGIGYRAPGGISGLNRAPVGVQYRAPIAGPARVTEPVGLRTPVRGNPRGTMPEVIRPRGIPASGLTARPGERAAEPRNVPSAVRSEPAPPRVYRPEPVSRPQGIRATPASPPQVIRSEPGMAPRSEPVRSSPTPRAESQPRFSPPPRVESQPRSSPPPRVESQPRYSPPPRPQSSSHYSAPQYSAPHYSAPRSAPAPRVQSAPRSAPSPHMGGSRGGGGGGRRH